MEETGIILVDRAESGLLTEISKKEQYGEMVKFIQAGYPEIQRATRAFNKSQSQYMDNMLTVSYITPIRNLRQMLAEMTRTRQALGEAYFNVNKKRVELKKKERDLSKCEDDLDREMLQIEIGELNYQIESTMEYVCGAIRKLANYQAQYNSVAEKFNLEGFTEKDFEEQEEKYHITRAFQQGLSAARAHGGIIDEGNHIYFEQMGVNGTQAQIEMSKYFHKEQEYIKEGKDVPHSLQVEWLVEMADKFSGCSKVFAEWKGQTGSPTDIAFARVTPK